MSHCSAPNCCVLQEVTRATQIFFQLPPCRRSGVGCFRYRERKRNNAMFSWRCCCPSPISSRQFLETTLLRLFFTWLYLLFAAIFMEWMEHMAQGIVFAMATTTTEITMVMLPLFQFLLVNCGRVSYALRSVTEFSARLAQRVYHESIFSVARQLYLYGPSFGGSWWGFWQGQPLPQICAVWTPPLSALHWTTHIKECEEMIDARITGALLLGQVGLASVLLTKYILYLWRRYFIEERTESTAA